MNRNVLWRIPKDMNDPQIERMNRFWGDSSWKDAAYKPSRQLNLFSNTKVHYSSPLRNGCVEVAL